jgi:hypothetical protein
MAHEKDSLLARLRRRVSDMCPLFCLTVVWVQTDHLRKKLRKLRLDVAHSSTSRSDWLHVFRWGLYKAAREATRV